jgi:hypothetical protein
VQVDSFDLCYNYYVIICKQLLVLKSGNHIRFSGKDFIEIRAIEDYSGKEVLKICAQDFLMIGAQEDAAGH